MPYYLIFATLLATSTGSALDAHTGSELPDKEGQHIARLLRVYVESIENIRFPKKLFENPNARYAVIGILWYPKAGIVGLARIEELHKSEDSKLLVADFLRNRSVTEMGFAHRDKEVDFLRNGLFKEVVDGETVLDVLLVRDKSKRSKGGLTTLMQRVFSALIPAAAKLSIGNNFAPYPAIAVTAFAKLLIEDYNKSYKNNVEILGRSSRSIYVKEVCGSGSLQLDMNLIIPTKIAEKYFEFEKVSGIETTTKSDTIEAYEKNGVIKLSIGCSSQ